MVTSNHKYTPKYKYLTHPLGFDQRIKLENIVHVNLRLPMNTATFSTVIWPMIQDYNIGVRWRYQRNYYDDDFSTVADLQIFDRNILTQHFENIFIPKPRNK